MGEVRSIKTPDDNHLNLARDILLGLALVGGVVVCLAIAPGLGIILGPMTKKYRRRSLETSQLKRRLNRLSYDGLLTISEQNGKTKLCLTHKGKQKVLEYQVDEMEIPKQVPWDSRYRFVMFDIPEKQKLARNIFREKLRALGFIRVQQSIWRHKYPCHDQIEFLTHLYRIGKYVILIEGRGRT